MDTATVVMVGVFMVFIASLVWDIHLMERRHVQLRRWVDASPDSEEKRRRLNAMLAILEGPEFVKRLKFCGSIRIFVGQLWKVMT